MSVDVRDSGFKIVSVDANIYPAGFNNICPSDKEEAPDIVKNYILDTYGTRVQKIAVLAEEHTKNAFYWENMKWILQIVKTAGFEVRVCFPQDLSSEMSFEASSGEKITVSPFRKEAGHLIGLDGFRPDLIISNNDFSNAYEQWAQDLKIPINPPRELGWHQRKKSQHFKFYNQLASEFAGILGLDPWTFTVQTDVYSNFNVNDVDSRNDLALEAEKMLQTISDKYKALNLNAKPTVFIKNNSGTYGLGVMSVQSGEDVRQMNSKARSKMKAAKGGKDVTEVILQEGVPTKLITDKEVAEPVIYIIGCELAGGFFRTHTQKGPEDSLNSPGAVFKRMCVSDLKVDMGGCPIENVYGWIARLSSLAIGLEAKEKQVKIGPNPL
jgi:glutamate--cysteine ligase